MYESETTGGAEQKPRRYSSDWGSVSLSRGGSRAGSPHGAAPAHPNAAPPFKSHSSDDIGSSWMRTGESVNSGAQSLASDWAEYDGYAAPESPSHRVTPQDPEAAATTSMMGMSQKPSLTPSANLEGARPPILHSRSNSDASSPARMLQQEVIRLQIEQDDMAARLKAEQARAREAEAKLAGLSSTMQQRLLQLATEVEARGSALERLREENESLTEDYNRLRAHSALMEEQAKSKVADLESQLADACRKAADAGVVAAAAHARAQQDGSAESQERMSAREDLEAQLEAAQTRAQAAVEAAASAQARAAATEVARDEAVRSRAASERSRRETEAQARAAAEVAAADRDERAAAEGLSEQLKAEADRRAKVFHNAVKAAIGKVQAELEAERDALEARLRQVEHALAEAQQDAAAAAAVTQEARREAAARTRDAEDAGSLAVAAQEAADAATARERAARAAAAVAEAALAELRGGAESLEKQVKEASARAQAAEAAAVKATKELEDMQQKCVAAASSAQMEIARWQSRAEAAAIAARETEAQCQAAATSSAATAANALQDARTAREQVAALEQELAQLRQARGSRAYGLPSRGEIMSSLGLDRWREERLLPTASSASSLDIEAANKKDKGRSSFSSDPLQRQLFGRDVGPAALRGHVTLRTWIVIGYLVLLHVAVMLSFTRQHDAHAACQEHALPGS